MENTNTQTMTYTFTPQQLADLIDDAFDLGKVYATDELNTLPAGFFANTTTAVYKRNDSTADCWTRFLDDNGGHGLHSGDAKLDLLTKHLVNHLRDNLDVDFD